MSRTRTFCPAPGVRGCPSSVLEKALLLQRTPLTGRKEPNAAPINSPKTRCPARVNCWRRRSATSRPSWRACAASWPPTPRWRSSGGNNSSRGESSGIYQGDTERNRLDTIQQANRTR